MIKFFSKYKINEAMLVDIELLRTILCHEII